MIKWRLSLTITELHLIFTLVMGIHLSMLGLAAGDGIPYVASQEEIELRKKMADAKKAEQEKREAEIAEAMAKGIYIRRAYAITYIGSKKLIRHSELLSLLAGNFNKGQTKILSKSTGVEISKSAYAAVEIDQKHDFKMTDDQKKNLLRRLLKERLSGVNTCKQKYSIEDEFLMGTIKVSMRIKEQGNLAQPKFNGHGNRKIIESLENCVKTQLVALNFPSELSNQEITFDVRIN